MKKKILLILIVYLITIGFASAIAIPTKLKIEAIPSTPKVNEEVRFLVTTEITNKPVSDAEIWIAKVGEGEPVETVIQALTEGKIGKLIGYTDQNGELRYSFDDYGVYVIQTKKEGYVGSVTTVTVEPLGRLKISTDKARWSYDCELPPEMT